MKYLKQLCATLLMLGLIITIGVANIFSVAADESLWTNYFSGSGTEHDPFIIEDTYDMKDLNAGLYLGFPTEGFYFKVKDGVTEIDLSTSAPQFLGIGKLEKMGGDWIEGFLFAGTFDGNGANFKIGSSLYYGIFPILAPSAHVMNMRITGSTLFSTAVNPEFHFTGALAGENRGTIENVHNEASIASNLIESSGGLVGMNSGTIRNCSNKGNVRNRLNDNDISFADRRGGIAGENKGTIQFCYNAGDVSGHSEIGGIVGYNDGLGIVYDVYNVGSVRAQNIAGGIAGENKGEIKHSYVAGIVYIKPGPWETACVGGLVGKQTNDSSSVLMDSYFNTSILSVAISKNEVRTADYPNKTTGEGPLTLGTTGTPCKAVLESEMLAAYPSFFDDYFKSDNWILLDDTTGGSLYYPQLKCFYQSSSSYIKDLSLQSALSKITFKATIDADGGVASQEYYYVQLEETYADVEDPAKLGYDFVYWKLDNNSNIYTTSKVQYAQNQTLKAIYLIIDYNLSYVVNGGGPVPPSTTYTVEDEVILTVDTYANHRFSGWYDNEDLTGTAITKIDKGSTLDKTFYGKWIPIFTIEYGLNGGTWEGDPGVASYATEDEDIVLINPTRVGYTFDGWYDNPEFDGEKVTTILSGSTGNQSFYAKWTQEVQEPDKPKANNSWIGLIVGIVLGLGGLFTLWKVKLQAKYVTVNGAFKAIKLLFKTKKNGGKE